MSDEDELIERVARAIASVNDDCPFDDLPWHKPDWLAKQGMFAGRCRDINEPFRIDYMDQAQAALAALPLSDYVLKHEAWDQLPSSRRRGAEEMRERCLALTMAVHKLISDSPPKNFIEKGKNRAALLAVEMILDAIRALPLESEEIA